MTTETDISAAEKAALEALDAGYNTDEAFARTELQSICELAVLETTYAPQDWLEVRKANIAYTSDAFKAAYPKGFPVLHIGLRGINVSYNFSPDKIRHIYIPLQGSTPEQYGKPKGRNSQIHIVSEAFVAVWKLRPFGTENRAQLVGKKAVWGQHLPTFEIGGQKIEATWDIPRTALPDNYEYTGEIKQINARQGSEAAGAAGVGTAALSEDEAKAAVLAVIVGMDGAEGQAAADKVAEIKGLPGWVYDACLTAPATLFKAAADHGWIVNDGGKVAAAPAA